jgi:hypothetical protein
MDLKLTHILMTVTISGNQIKTKTKYELTLLIFWYMRAIWKVRGLGAVCRCYAAEGGDDYYAKL